MCSEEKLDPNRNEKQDIIGFNFKLTVFIVFIYFYKF